MCFLRHASPSDTDAENAAPKAAFLFKGGTIHSHMTGYIQSSRATMPGIDMLFSHRLLKRMPSTS